MNVTDQRTMAPQIKEKISKAGVVAVIVIDKAGDTVPLANALLEGGIDTIELTLRTPAAMEAAGIISKEFPEITLGIGTVLTVDQVKAVTDQGVDFAVSPGCNPGVLNAARELGLSFAPGIMTPSDIEIAVELGCRVLKFFPAESSGGLKHLTGMANPYNHLGLTYIPLGGISMSNAGEYLASPLICAVGGSWIAKRSLIQAGDWKTITKNAREMRNLITKLRD